LSGTQVNDLLLTALALAFAHWTGDGSLLIDLEGHGREDIFEDIDLTRTVGWFASVFPVLLDINNATTPSEALKAVSKQLHEIPQRGIGYGLLRYMSGDEMIFKQCRSSCQAEVRFNYLGQFDQVISDFPLFKLANESIRAGSNITGNRKYLIEIDGGLTEGQLRFRWSYSQNVHCLSSIESLAQIFIENLQSLIAHYRHLEAESEIIFPLAQLDAEELEYVLSMASHQLEEMS
jgi:non-ribosomal peptide synthase protein (TIGR01720 family)